MLGGFTSDGDEAPKKLFESSKPAASEGPVLPENDFANSDFMNSLSGMMDENKFNFGEPQLPLDKFNVGTPQIKPI